MRFADPLVCPDCRGALQGGHTCPHCGLDLSSVEVRQLWQVLLQADDLLARAKRSPARQQTTQPPQHQPPQHQPPQHQPPQHQPPQQAPAAQQPLAPQGPVVPPVGPGAFPAYPVPQPAPREPRSWSVGTILLVLGPFSLIVAGLIFVTTSWEDLGLAARTLILLGITVVATMVGFWVTMRPLRASAEAIWTIFLSLLTLDFFAARHEGMAGLGRLDIAWAWVVWGIITLGLGIGLILWSRKPLGTDLIAPSIAGALGIAMTGVGAGGVGDDWDLSWRSIVALVAAGLLALAGRPAGIRWLTISSRIVVAGFFVFAYLAAAVELLDNPSLDELVSGRHGVSMLLMAFASVVIAAVVKPVRICATALAVLAVALLVVVPSERAWEPEGVWLSVSLLAAGFAIAGVRGANEWVRGLRIGAIPAIVGLVLIQFGMLSDLMETIGSIVDDPWSTSAGTRIDTPFIHGYAVWPVPIVVVALLVAAWFVPRWPELAKIRNSATSVLIGAAVLAVADATVAMRLPLWAAVVVLLLGAVSTLILQIRRPTFAVLVGPAAIVLVAVGSLLALAHQGTSVAAWTVGAIVLAGLALVEGEEITRQISSIGAVALTAAAVGSATDLAGAQTLAVAIAVLVTGLAFLTVVGLRGAGHPVRLPVEITAAIVSITTLVGDGSASEIAVRWTILGVVLVALSFAVSDRRWYLPIGLGALVVAYVLLIIDSGFTFVEAYTLPLGAVALGVGLFLMQRGETRTNTWLYLGPGLALSLLPSVPQALAEPTELRALLLGLGALAALAVGVRLSWQAPFVSGALILTLLVLFNIGPYANAAPRVVVLAIIGVLLTGIGITWEDRIRDGRRIVAYVRSMD